MGSTGLGDSLLASLHSRILTLAWAVEASEMGSSRSRQDGTGMTLKKFEVGRVQVKCVYTYIDMYRIAKRYR
jgi:hypothetical protein